MLIALLVMSAICSSANESYGFSPRRVRLQVAITRKPQPAPVRWRPLIGEYGRDSETVIILESDAKLCALFKRTELAPLKQLTSDSFEFDSSTARKRERVVRIKTFHEFFDLSQRTDLHFQDQKPDVLDIPPDTRATRSGKPSAG